MAAVEAESVFLTQADISKYDYAAVARQFQNAIADIAQTLPQMCTTLPKQSKYVPSHEKTNAFIVYLASPSLLSNLSEDCNDRECPPETKAWVPETHRYPPDVVTGRTHYDAMGLDAQTSSDVKYTKFMNPSV